MTDLEFVNEDPSISDRGSHNESIAFVNDWSELEEALTGLRDQFGPHFDCEPDYCDEWEVLPMVKILVDYVPRLLTQYASLVELSFALTEGWEHYATLQGPTGLYLPDHR